MKTIPRNHTRKIAVIKAAATSAVRHAEDNHFAGVTVAPTAAWAALDTYSFARLIDNENDTYTVAVHSNLWYTLTAPATDEATPPTPDLSPAMRSALLTADPLSGRTDSQVLVGTRCALIERGLLTFGSVNVLTDAGWAARVSLGGTARPAESATLREEQAADAVERTTRTVVDASAPPSPSAPSPIPPTGRASFTPQARPTVEEPAEMRQALCAADGRTGKLTTDSSHVIAELVGRGLVTEKDQPERLGRTPWRRAPLLTVAGWAARVALGGEPQVTRGAGGDRLDGFMVSALGDSVAGVVLDCGCGWNSESGRTGLADLVEAATAHRRGGCRRGL